MKGEVWKDVPGYHDLFQASTFGRIRKKPRYVFVLNLKPSRYFIRKFIRPMEGFVLSKLKNPSRKKNTVTVCPRPHRIIVRAELMIAAAFLGKMPDNCKVYHINGDDYDDRPSNLRYLTGGKC